MSQLFTAMVRVGLSPHPRGNLRGVAYGNGRYGPIPASAGEPHWCPESTGWRRAYPRIRGGTDREAYTAVRAWGLSPHPRGNLGSSLKPILIFGPIPASAGEPVRPPLAWGCRWAYPRIRGGTGLAGAPSARNLGLSPHPRGNHSFYQPGPRRRGPIPASAGEPDDGRQGFATGEAYPRIRGGTGEGLYSGATVQGLSPHPRGNHTRNSAAGGKAGPIPASAGEPAPSGKSTLPSRAYPRIRGGTQVRHHVLETLWGLSPHPRGNQRAAVHKGTGHGPIPASAGEP